MTTALPEPGAPPEAEEPGGSTEFRWDRLAYASTLAFCLLVAVLSVGVVLGELREEFHLSGVVAALHGSTFGIGLLIMGTIGVRLVDRFGRRAVLALACAAATGGITVFALGGAWPVTLLGTAISGTACATLVMVMPGMVSDHYGEQRATAFAAINGAPALAGVAFSLVVGGALGAGWSWRPPYLALTWVFAIAVVVVGRKAPVPRGERHAPFSLRHLADRDILRPWSYIVNAVLAEFSVGVWAVTYLREVGGASDGMAPVLAVVFPVMMLTTRLTLPAFVRRFGPAATSVSFATIGIGAAAMCLTPSLEGRVVALTIVGLGAGPLYPLTVDRLYAEAGPRLDSVSLGAYCALASGLAVTLGPLVLGVLADAVGLRWAILVVPVLALIGGVSQWPRRIVTLP